MMMMMMMMMVVIIMMIMMMMKTMKMMTAVLKKNIKLSVGKIKKMGRMIEIEEPSVSDIKLDAFFLS